VTTSTAQTPENFGYVTAVPPTIGPLSGWFSYGKLKDSMALESTSKDNLKVEKFSLLVLALCIVVLVYLIVVRPF